MARGDITVKKTGATQFLADFPYVRISGTTLITTTSAKDAVKVRQSDRSFRVSVGSATVEALGGATEVAFKMSLDRSADGGRKYTIVPAKGGTVHGVVKTRS